MGLFWAWLRHRVLYARDDTLDNISKRRPIGGPGSVRRRLAGGSGSGGRAPPDGAGSAVTAGWYLCSTVLRILPKNTPKIYQACTKHIPNIYQKYAKKKSKYIQDISQISKINKKYQAAAGPARSGPSPGPRMYTVFILDILDMSWMCFW